MRVYGQINALPPAGTGKKRAHMIGGGRRSWSSDGAVDHVNGDTARGDREVVPSMEALWDVLKQPSQIRKRWNGPASLPV